MCILDLEESEVTNDGTQEFWEVTRTAVIRGLITSCVGSLLIFMGRLWSSFALVQNLPPGGRWPSKARSEEEFGQKTESQYHLKTC